MRRITFISLFLFIFLLCLATISHAALAGKISILEGRVDVLKSGKDVVAPVKQGDPVDVGDMYRAKSDGRVEITFINGNILKIAPNTRAEIKEAMIDAQGSIHVVKLHRGRIQAISSEEFIKKVSSFAEKNKFEVHTQNAVAGIRGSSMIVSFMRGITGTLFTTGRGYQFNPGDPRRVIVNIVGGTISFVTTTTGSPSPPRQATSNEITVQVKSVITVEKPKDDKPKEGGKPGQTAQSGGQTSAGTSQSSGGSSGSSSGGSSGTSSGNTSTSSTGGDSGGSSGSTTSTGGSGQSSGATTGASLEGGSGSSTTASSGSVSGGPNPGSTTSASSGSASGPQGASPGTSASAWVSQSGSSGTPTSLSSVTGSSFTGAVASATISSNITNTPTVTTTVTAPVTSYVPPPPPVIVQDTTPPTLTIISKPDAITGSGNAHFQVSADKTSTFEYTIDSATWTSLNGTGTNRSFNINGLLDGTHSIDVRAISTAGYTSSTSSYSWFVDATDPVVTITSKPNSQTAQSSATFTFSANESVTYQYRLDGGSWISAGSLLRLSDLSEGNHQIEVRARDTIAFLLHFPERSSF